MTADLPGLQRFSAVPLWRQLSDLLRQQIRTGLLGPGARIPTEPQLGATYGVSRITVRAAVDRLLAEQLVVRKQGKGTFVAARLRQELSDLAGIIPGLEAQGIRFQTRLVLFDREPIPAGLAASPTTSPTSCPAAGHGAARDGGSDAAMHYRRLYEMNGEPFGLCEIWIPDAAAITREQAERAPCYAILSRHLGRTVAGARLTIKVKRPAPWLAQLLAVKRGETLLCLERVSFSASGETCECTCFWVRPDRYEFGVDVQGQMPIVARLVPTS